MSASDDRRSDLATEMVERRGFNERDGVGLATSLMVIRQQVRVEGLRIAAYIGAHAHETDRQQILDVDVELEVKPADRDDLSAIIDYGDVVTYAEELARRHISLIETYSFKLAEKCMEHPKVSAARVTVRKPGALINGIATARTSLRQSPGHPNSK